MGRRASGKRKESRKGDQAETKRKMEDNTEKQDMMISMSDDSWMYGGGYDDGLYKASDSAAGSAQAPRAVSDELMLEVQQAVGAVHNNHDSLRSMVLNLRGKGGMLILAGGMRGDDVRAARELSSAIALR